jgi:hypothetical protein
MFDMPQTTPMIREKTMIKPITTTKTTIEKIRLPDMPKYEGVDMRDFLNPKKKKKKPKGARYRIHPIQELRLI